MSNPFNGSDKATKIETLIVDGFTVVLPVLGELNVSATAGQAVAVAISLGWMKQTLPVAAWTRGTWSAAKNRPANNRTDSENRISFFSRLRLETKLLKEILFLELEREGWIEFGS